MLTQFRGNPYESADWRARPLTSMRQLDPAANVYLTVSAMRRNARGEYRRRKDNFAAGLLLMVDDVGTKVPWDVVEPLPPTAMIETSPDNFQAIYMFDRAWDDREAFTRLISGFIERQLLGADSGMSGVNRVFRPPFGRNSKPRYGAEGWGVRMTQWHPERRYSPQHVAEAFGVELSGPPRRPVPRGATADQAGLIRHFVEVRAALRAAGMLKTEEPNLEGWQDVRCPWTAEHSGGADNGAAIRHPDEANGWHGAFRCHHGHCAERGWRELTGWLAEEQGEVLAAVNAAAPAELIQEDSNGNEPSSNFVG